MSLTLGDNFSYLGTKPLDGRIKYNTISEMVAMSDSTLYDGILAYCVADGKSYQWKSTNEVDVTLGKWREFSSGAVDSVNGKTGAVVLNANDVGALPDNTSIPSKTSDLNNDSGFITKSVDDLTNYTTTNDLNTALGNKVNTSSVGTAGGVAELDNTGKVPSSQLPSYVDDVIEGYYKEADGKFYEEDTYTTEIIGETGKIYISLDSNIQYRWTGSVFSALGGALVLGETSSTAYRGDRGKTAYDHSQTTSGNPHNVGKSDVGLGNVDNTSDLNKPISTATQTALNSKEGVFRYTTMPTASATNEGDIVQYVGTTTSSYTNGYFYECVEDSGSYSWEAKSVQAGGGVSDFDDLTNRPQESDAIDIDDLDLRMPAKPTDYPILFDETGTEYKVGLYKRASDGKVKPVYRKDIVSIVSSTGWQTITNITAIEKVIKISSAISKDSETWILPAYRDNYYNGVVVINTTNKIFSVNVSSELVGGELTSSVLYTKTTDEWKEV